MQELHTQQRTEDRDVAFVLSALSPRSLIIKNPAAAAAGPRHRSPMSAANGGDGRPPSLAASPARPSAASVTALAGAVPHLRLGEPSTTGPASSAGVSGYSSDDGGGGLRSSRGGRFNRGRTQPFFIGVAGVANSRAPAHFGKALGSQGGATWVAPAPWVPHDVVPVGVQRGVRSYGAFCHAGALDRAGWTQRGNTTEHATPAASESAGLSPLADDPATTPFPLPCPSSFQAAPRPARRPCARRFASACTTSAWSCCPRIPSTGA
jgi:hypothetical protein